MLACVLPVDEVRVAWSGTFNFLEQRPGPQLNVKRLYLLLHSDLSDVAREDKRDSYALPYQ